MLINDGDYNLICCLLMLLVIKVNDDDGVSDIFLLMLTIVLWLV